VSQMMKDDAIDDVTARNGLHGAIRSLLASLVILVERSRTVPAACMPAPRKNEDA